MRRKACSKAKNRKFVSARLGYNASQTREFAFLRLEICLAQGI